jgi:hypothetical protein
MPQSGVWLRSTIRTALNGYCRSKRLAPVIGLHGFADYGESFPERFMTAVQRKASAVIEAPWPARIAVRRPIVKGGISSSFMKTLTHNSWRRTLEPDSWSKIEMTSIGAPI